MTINRVRYKSFSDERGRLVPFDLNTEPFSGFIRMFILSDLTLGQMRGNHAHRLIKQLMIVVQGKFLITYEKDRQKYEIILDTASDALILPPLTWSTQTPLTADAVMLVFADGVYDESEYVRDYEEFKLLFEEREP